MAWTAIMARRMYFGGKGSNLGCSSAKASLTRLARSTTWEACWANTLDRSSMQHGLTKESVSGYRRGREQSREMLPERSLHFRYW